MEQSSAKTHAVKTWMGKRVAGVTKVLGAVKDVTSKAAWAAGAIVFLIFLIIIIFF